MEKIKLSEQEIVNAICLHVASKKQIQPNDVSVELIWDEDYGFSAEVFALNRQQVFIEANLIEAIRFWLQTQLHRDPYAAAVELVLDDNKGVIAFATYHA